MAGVWGRKQSPQRGCFWTICENSGGSSDTEAVFSEHIHSHILGGIIKRAWPLAFLVISESSLNSSVLLTFQTFLIDFGDFWVPFVVLYKILSLVQCLLHEQDRLCVVTGPTPGGVHTSVTPWSLQPCDCTFAEIPWHLYFTLGGQHRNSGVKAQSLAARATSSKEDSESDTGIQEGTCIRGFH